MVSFPPNPTITSSLSVPVSTSLPSVPTIVATFPSQVGGGGAFSGAFLSSGAANAVPKVNNKTPKVNTTKYAKFVDLIITLLIFVFSNSIKLLKPKKVKQGEW